MNTCENCDGEGGWARIERNWYGEADSETWDDCPACGGCGWVYADPPQLDMDEAFES
jgi:DnaJ-class molecular chaperone